MLYRSGINYRVVLKDQFEGVSIRLKAQNQRGIDEVSSLDCLVFRNSL
jgi:hypothetical protein